MKKDIVTEAYNDFMTRLFGYVPENPQELEVDRETYKQHMRAVQDAYGLDQGHPDYLHFILTMVGRSPRIIKEDDQS